MGADPRREHGNATGRRPVDLHAGRLVEAGRYGTRIHEDGRGWSLTARIPWSHLGDFRPVADSTITGGFKVNLGDVAGRKVTLSLFWSGSGREWVDPSQWGSLQMKYLY